MKYTSIALIGAMALLTACSSGGGSTQPNTSTPVVNANTNSTNANTTTATSSTNTPAVGSITSSRNGTKTNGFTPITTATNLNELNFMGQTISLLPDGFSVGKWFKSGGITFNGVKQSAREIYFGNSDSRFGYIATDNGADSYDVYFAQGNVTKNLPTASTAKYSGVGVHEQNKSRITTKWEATADFGTKTFKGDIKDETNAAKLVGIDATFDSTGKITQTGNTNVSAQFYGDNAAEIAGTYYSKDYQGAFGGKKQKQ